MHRKLYFIVFLFWAGAAYGQLLPSEQAKKSSDFVGSIGINIHAISDGATKGDPTFPYANTTWVKSRLSELGLKYFRVDARDISTDWPFFKTLHDTLGLNANYLFTSTFWTWPHVSSFLRTYGYIAETIEGPNETDCHTWVYNGASFPSGTIAFQNALYDTVKAVPATATKLVIGPSVCNFGVNEYQVAGAKFDISNTHSYAMGYQPTYMLDTYIAQAKKSVSPVKPVIATETGYLTSYYNSATWTKSISEAAQAKYYPRLFAENWNRGIQKTYAYELYDEGVDSTDVELSFGIIHYNNTPKPAFYVIKNMIALLKDAGTSFAPGQLKFAISGNTSNVSHTLLQKASGDYYLILWQDVSSYNTGAMQNTTVPPVPVSLQLDAAYHGGIIYTFNSTGGLDSLSSSISAGVFNLNLTDAVTIVKFSLTQHTYGSPVTPVALSGDVPKIYPFATPINIPIGSTGSVTVTRSQIATVKDDKNPSLQTGISPKTFSCSDFGQKDVVLRVTDGTFAYTPVNPAAASFNSPYGIAIDRSGNTYLADQLNQRIRKISVTGTVTTLAGSGTAAFANGTGTAASFNNPYYIAVDSLNNVYVADQENNRIRKITPAGVVTTFAGSGTATSADGTGTSASFNKPRGIAIDKLQNLYVTDNAGNKIRKITPAGVVTTIAGSGFAGNTDGTGSSATFSSLSQLALDTLNNLFVVQYNNIIRKVTPAGVVTTIAGSLTAGAADGTGASASFNAPRGIAIDQRNIIYIADFTNHRIRQMTTAGVVTTLAGNGIKGAQDAGEPTFKNPVGIAVDPWNQLYVSEYGNCDVRRISTDRMVSTIAGTGTAGYVDGTVGTFARGNELSKAITIVITDPDNYCGSGALMTNSLTVVPQNKTAEITWNDPSPAQSSVFKLLRSANGTDYTP